MSTSYANNPPNLKSHQSHTKTAPITPDLTIIPKDMPNTPTESATATHVTRTNAVLNSAVNRDAGTSCTYLTFGGCNYLALAHHPKVVAAAQAALQTFGLSTSASRQTTGNARPHANLEAALADFTNAPAALLLPDGYTANLAALQALKAQGIQHALLDTRAHASLYDAAKLAQMTIHTYNHLDAHHASQILNTLNQPAVILTDAVFTTDGDIAPAQQLVQLLDNQPNQHHLLLDDCHGFAVLGKDGRGTANHLNISHPNLIITTTLLKGLGCAGGVVIASSELIESAINTSTAYICTTPASPALAAAGLTALQILQSSPERHQQLQSNITHTRAILNALGITTHNNPTPIFAFTLGTKEDMEAIEQRLLDQHIILPLMHYPNGPAPTYFRLSLNADHTQDHINQLNAALTNALKVQHA